MLIATVGAVVAEAWPASGRTASMAEVSTHVPSSRMRFEFSATATNSPGATRPHSGCCHRTSASTATIWFVRSETSGWKCRTSSSRSVAPRERVLHLGSAERAGLHLLVEVVDGAAAALLGHLTGGVGLAQQLVGGDVAGGRRRHADRRGEEHLGARQDGTGRRTR